MFPIIPNIIPKFTPPWEAKNLPPRSTGKVTREKLSTKRADMLDTLARMASIRESTSDQGKVLRLTFGSTPWKSSWGLNQANWKICASQIGSSPQGWKKYLKPPPRNYPKICCKANVKQVALCGQAIVDNKKNGPKTQKTTHTNSRRSQLTNLSKKPPFRPLCQEIHVRWFHRLISKGWSRYSHLVTHHRLVTTPENAVVLDPCRNYSHPVVASMNCWCSFHWYLEAPSVPPLCVLKKWSLPKIWRFYQKTTPFFYKKMDSWQKVRLGPELNLCLISKKKTCNAKMTSNSLWFGRI